MLNKQTGNMYPFVTHTFNVLKGKCPHDCVYCYMKRFPQKELRFDESELKTKLGHHNFIFVGSSTDMWADNVPSEFIHRILKHCRDNDAYNKYLFQTKNPARFKEFTGFFPDDTTLGCTIETNRQYFITISNAPSVYDRYLAMKYLPNHKMISIEPIMDFDLFSFVIRLQEINPSFVSIGADSKGHHLPEPSKDKVDDLIKALSEFTTVKIKKNLARLTS